MTFNERDLKTNKIIGHARGVNVKALDSVLLSLIEKVSLSRMFYFYKTFFAF